MFFDRLICENRIIDFLRAYILLIYSACGALLYYQSLLLLILGIVKIIEPTHPFMIFMYVTLVLFLMAFVASCFISNIYSCILYIFTRFLDSCRWNPSGTTDENSRMNVAHNTADGVQPPSYEDVVNDYQNTAGNGGTETSRV